MAETKVHEVKWRVRICSDISAPTNAMTESIGGLTRNITNTALDMAVNATEKATDVLLPLAMNVIIDTVLTNYTQSMCDELAAINVGSGNGT